jgi:hypothetical protein
LLSRAARDQAARTVSRNLLTSSLRRLLSFDSDCAAERTCDEAEPVSVAPLAYVADVGADLRGAQGNPRASMD